jgi:hypothetical protein
MALLTSEIRRIKAELGYNVLASGAEPYIGVHAVFEQVVQTYMTSGATTTSSTAVTAATSPTPVTLTLASGTGFSQFDRIVVDVDDRQEIATASLVSGVSLTVQLTKAHSGTYPVSVEGGEQIVRSMLRQLDLLSKPGALLEKSASTAGIKKVDEIEFATEAGSSKRIEEVQALREYYRQELADALGVQNLRAIRSGSNGTLSVY